MNSAIRKGFPIVSLIIFNEHPIVNYLVETPGVFDISSRETDFSPDFIQNNTFSFFAYCTQLIRKLISLQPDEIIRFLKYQASQLKEPIVWLRRLETLIHVNTENLIIMNHLDLVTSILLQIDGVVSYIKHPKYSGTIPLHEPVIYKYPFHEILAGLTNLNSYEDKMVYLIKHKTEYLQNEPLYINKNEKPLNILIDLEIEKLEQIKLILESKTMPWENMEVKKPTMKPDKIRFNGQLNILVDVFYQMKNSSAGNGLPFLDSSIQEITDLITYNFLDKDGNEISQATVRTILSPNRPEKRPKNDKRFSLRQ